MLSYIDRRILYSIPLLVLISFISFIVITLPPGDYMTAMQDALVRQGNLSMQEARAAADVMRAKYGLDKPMLVQYQKWVFGVVKGDFGYSFKYRRPVSEIIWRKLGWTFLIALGSLLVSLIGGLLPGIYSATHQYGFRDNVFTVLAYIGLSIPNFFLALALLYALVFWFKVPSVGGLFSPQMVMAPWSWAKFVDFLGHIWVPIVVVGVAGMARNMRVIRGNLLDILGQPYIQTARSKGLAERTVIFKHALKNAIQPMIMYLGMSLPWLIQGAMVTAVVLNLPTTGPMFVEALMDQDMYLAGSFLLMIAVFTVIGNLLADIALAAIDPRVRYD